MKFHFFRGGVGRQPVNTIKNAPEAIQIYLLVLKCLQMNSISCKCSQFIGKRFYLMSDASSWKQIFGLFVVIAPWGKASLTSCYFKTGWIYRDVTFWSYNSKGVHRWNPKLHVNFNYSLHIGCNTQLTLWISLAGRASHSKVSSTK